MEMPLSIAALVLMFYIRYTHIDCWVVSKSVPMSEVHRDMCVSELYINDKVERRASWSLLRAVIAQQQALRGPNVLEQSFLPTKFRVLPVQRGQRRVFLDCGDEILVTEPGGKLLRILPKKIDLGGLVMTHHVVDRHSTNLTCIFHMMHVGGLWVVSFGSFHDLWNAVKHSSAQCGDGSDVNWTWVRKAASLFNFNHGPFRSSAWGRAKQEALKTIMESLDSTDAGFRAVAREQAILDGVRRGLTDVEYEERFKAMGSMPSCHEAGPACKFSRWMSVFDCWKFFRGEVWYNRLVISTMAEPNADLDKEVARMVESTQNMDSNQAQDLAAKGPGLMARIPKFICWRMIDSLELFDACTLVWQKFYSYRASSVKTIADAVQFRANHLKGGKYLDNYGKMLCGTFSNMQLATTLCLQDDPQRGPRNASHLWQMLFGLSREIGMREFMQLLQPPGSWAQLLSEDLDVALGQRCMISRHYKILIEAENMAFTCDDVSMVLESIVWRSWPVIRLAFTILQSEEASGRRDFSDELTLVLAVALRQPPDEKGAEDIHQHVRDLPRACRQKRVAPNTLFNAVMDCGVTEVRAEEGRAISVTDEEVSLESWRCATEKPKLSNLVAAPPAQWPRKLNQVLNPSYKFPSPSVPGFFNSMLSWQRLLACGASNRLQDCSRSWCSRLLQPRDIITFDGQIHCVVLAVGLWGYLCLPVVNPTVDTPGVFVPTRDQPIQVKFLLTSDFDRLGPVVRQGVGVPSPCGGGIVLQESGGGVWLMRDLCLRHSKTYIPISIYYFSFYM